MIERVEITLGALTALQARAARLVEHGSARYPTTMAGCGDRGFGAACARMVR